MTTLRHDHGWDAVLGMSFANVPAWPLYNEGTEARKIGWMAKKAKSRLGKGPSAKTRFFRRFLTGKKLFLGTVAIVGGYITLYNFPARLEPDQLYGDVNPCVNAKEISDAQPGMPSVYDCQTLRFAFQFTNLGKTRADDVHTSLNWQFVNTDHPFAWNVFEKNAKSISSLEAGKPEYIPSPFLPLSPQAYWQLLNGTDKAYVTATIWYRDILRRNHARNYCGIYVPANNMVFICPGGLPIPKSY